MTESLISRILILQSMKKYIVCFCVIASCFLAGTVSAQESPMGDSGLDIPHPDEFFKALVLEVTDQGLVNEEADKQYYQTVRVRFLDGSEAGKETEVTTTNFYPKAAPDQALEPGDTIVISKTSGYDGEPFYQISDQYRLDKIIFIVVFFVLLALWLGRKRGATSLLGLAFSILVLAFYVVPQILEGKNPFLIILTGSIVIVALSLYLAHGFNRRTSIAVVSTVLTLAAAIVMSVVFVKFAKLFGLGSEDAYFLIFARDSINLQGLLLGGIIIGTLGVLDDITTAQTAVIEELRRANSKLSRKELYIRGLSVGHEHIASLINTLVLAYAGTSLPIFLLFTLNTYQPIWTIFNSEFVAEEIVRTLIGSSTLILSVPISTFLAAYFLTRPNVRIEPRTESHVHHH